MHPPQGKGAPVPDAPGAAITRRERIVSIFGGSAGNLVEWYDWYVYSAFALYFAPVFFPAGDRTVQLLNAAAIFAAGFLVRPVGAWIMGNYADRHGRKAGLSLSVTLMCAGSMLIALTPPYAAIGLWAPVLLIIARLLQGLSIGGEYGSSATYLSEMADDRHRGFYSSFQYVTLIMGQLVALAVQITLQAGMSEAALESWGWRIPFALGGMLALLVLYLRRRMRETHSFTQAKTKSTAPGGAFALLRHHPAQALLVMALTAGGTLAFYAYSVYMQKFLVNTAGFGRETVSRIMATALFLYMLMQPAFGALSDKVGRKPLMIGFGLLGMIATVPIFRALETAPGPLAAFGLVMIALTILSGYTSINAVVKAELFPTHIRALGVALPYALTNALFGGSAEYVALQLKAWGHESAFYWYVTALIALSLIAYVLMPESKRVSLESL